MKQREGRGARLRRRRTSTCRDDATQADVARRDPRVQRRPRRRRDPRAAPDAAADRLRSRAARDRSRQGRRRAAPGEPGPARAVDARARCRARPPGSRRCSRTTRSRSPGREVVILGRGHTLGRPLALLLSQKRPTANAAVTVVHTGVPDWPEYTQRADIVDRRGGRARHPAARAHHARARWSSAAACATRAASCCPTSTSAARRSRAGSRPASAASARRRSRCCSATRSRPPSATGRA